jgi:hypothetical protein
MEIKYAHLDGIAVRLTNTEAWSFTRGAWHEMNSGEANHKATLLNAETFNKMYPELPALPAAAFKT